VLIGMVDQAEGLRQKRNEVRVLSVLGASAQFAGTGFAAGMANAWSRLGASPLLIDSVGVSARSLLGCHPMHEWDALSHRPFGEHILLHGGKAAVVAKCKPAGDASLVREAVALGYRELVCDAGAMDADDVPINAMCAQGILLLASHEHLETAYALLKALDQASSPADIWLLWNSEREESKRLLQICRERLDRAPCFLVATPLSRMGHAFERNCLSISLQDNDFLEIVTKMLAKQSVRGEETSNRTKRHA
jgi:hypothetical protein